MGNEPLPLRLSRRCDARVQLQRERRASVSREDLRPPARSHRPASRALTRANPSAERTRLRRTLGRRASARRASTRTPASAVPVERARPQQRAGERPYAARRSPLRRARAAALGGGITGAIGTCVQPGSQGGANHRRPPRRYAHRRRRPRGGTAISAPSHVAGDSGGHDACGGVHCVVCTGDAY